MTVHPFKLGRLPRIHLPGVPHLSSLLAGLSLPPPPASVDYTAGMPSNLGAMLNDQLGDCTIAAMFHALQVWSFNATGTMLTAPDSDVLATYESFCGYNPSNPSTDQGGVEQNVLADWVSQGIPTGTGSQVQQLAAFVEVDPRNTEDVQRTIDWCGVCYLGISVPSYLMQSLTAPGSTWGVQHANTSIVGGHAVILAGYNATTAKVISWGNFYEMTWAFLHKYCDESYALADADWIAATGKTPAGWTLAQLEQQMSALKEAA